jgi:hypothetical protein
MPKPVQTLLRVVHVEGIDIHRLSRGDLEMISMLKAHHPLLYQQLREQLTCRASPPQHRSPGRSRSSPSPR